MIKQALKGYDAPSAYTPRIKPDYVFHEAMRELVVWFMNPADPLYVFGPTGSGKTSLIHQVAARLNYPVFDITGHGRREFNDLAGHLTVENGSMRFQYGPLALAMKFDGLFLLNETARYAHLAADPVKQAAERVSERLGTFLAKSRAAAANSAANQAGEDMG